MATPRIAIQLAFQGGLISDGHSWIDALQKRNLLAHSYNEQYALEAEELIRNIYSKMLRDACQKREKIS